MSFILIFEHTLAVPTKSSLLIKAPVADTEKIVSNSDIYIQRFVLFDWQADGIHRTHTLTNAPPPFKKRRVGGAVTCSTHVCINIYISANFTSVRKGATGTDGTSTSEVLKVTYWVKLQPMRRGCFEFPCSLGLMGNVCTLFCWSCTLTWERWKRRSFSVLHLHISTSRAHSRPSFSPTDRDKVLRRKTHKILKKKNIDLQVAGWHGCLLSVTGVRVCDQLQWRRSGCVQNHTLSSGNVLKETPCWK